MKDSVGKQVQRFFNRGMALQGRSTEEIYESLTVRDVQMAADLFRPLYDCSDGRHGFVSLEVNPHLARDVKGTLAEARRLWKALDRPNVMIKVPGTRQGLACIRRLISEGVNVNVTLLFGLPRYRKVAQAFIEGLEARAELGRSLTSIASVASFFLSRIDVMVDPILKRSMDTGNSGYRTAERIYGQVAIASARCAYQIYKELFHGERFKALADKGARPQRLLWASTSTKEPEFSDIKYVEALIGPETINTLPRKTIDAYRAHGQPAQRLDRNPEQAREILKQLAALDINIDQVTSTLVEQGIEKFIRPYDRITPPEDLQPGIPLPAAIENRPAYRPGDLVPTRDAFGNALKRIQPAFPQLVSLDGEVGNSTRAAYFMEACPERFFEMFIAEQNMVGAAIGLASRGKLPFVSTFGAFFTRAFDQIRMSQYSNANIKFVGSHAGVSIGPDGPSQMALEDIAMFRSIMDGVVLYPADAVSTERLVEAAALHPGIVYLRTHRGSLPVIYTDKEAFAIGGSKVLRNSDADVGTIVAAGVTLHEALAAQEKLRADGIHLRVIDLYSIQPPDRQTLHLAAEQTRFFVTVEDHCPAGGIGETVQSVVARTGVPVYSLCVRKRPMSGKPQELLDYEAISSAAIVRQVQEAMETPISGEDPSVIPR